MQDKDLYIKFICSNLHIQNIFHTSKTIHKMKFFQISIVKSIYWLKKKIITWYNAFPIAKKKLEKNWRKKFKYVIHSHSSIDLHLVATQGELLGTCPCNILDLSPFIFRWTSDCEQIFWSNTTISWCSDQALFFFPRLGTSGASSLYWICNYKKKYSHSKV